MRNPDQERGPLARLARWWRNCTGHHAARAEFDAPGSHGVQTIAQDLGLSSVERGALAGKWPDSADLLERRMAGLRLDPAEGDSADPV